MIFFAFIRFCYNQRANNPSYQRLTFALFGVATPSDLIQDKKRTPFNIGVAVNLTGFQLLEAMPLIQGFPAGLEKPAMILEEIIKWTDGQPFLTQKICRIVSESFTEENLIEQSEQAKLWVANLIQRYVIDNWESHDQPEHLQTIRDRLNYDEKRKGRILGIYQQILQQYLVTYDRSREHTELILSGLVIRQDKNLRVKNRIYAEVFNLDWVQQALEILRPYSQTFTAWILSGQSDSSRLLRGQALQDALAWSQGKSLSDLDYQFISASTEIDRQEIQQKLELERTKAIEIQLLEKEKRLQQEQKNSRLQKWLLILLGTAFILVSCSMMIAIQQYWRARLSEIRALIDSSQGMFAADRQLEAMIAAITARQKLHKLPWANPSLMKNIEIALDQTIYNNNEFNRLIGHQGGVLTVDISPNDQLIVTGSNDKTAKIWSIDGRLLQTLPHDATVHRVVFSPDSQSIISASLDGKIHIWQINGALVKVIDAHRSPVWGIDVSSDGQYIASASGDRTVKIWTITGELKHTLQGHIKSVWNVAFSPDGQILVSVGIDGQIKLWNMQGNLLKNLSGHIGSIWDVAFCQNNLLVSVGSDQKVYLWRTNGQLVKTLPTDYPILGVDCQGGYIITSGRDNMATIWKKDGSFIRKLPKHQAGVRDVALNSNGLLAVSVSDDGTAKMWQRNQYLMKPIKAHKDTVWSIATSHDHQLFTSTSTDNTMKVWDKTGQILQVFDQTKNGNILAIAFSPDQPMMITGGSNRELQIWDMQAANKSQVKLSKILLGHNGSIVAVTMHPHANIIASASDDQTIKLWNTEGQLLKSWFAHSQRIWQIVFSPNGEILASASEDGTVKLWDQQGKLINTLRHTGAVWGVAFHPQNNLILTTSRNNTLNFWSEDGQLKNSISGESGGLTKIAISQNGQLIATGGIDNTIKLWNNQGKLLRTLSGHKGMVTSLAFTADHRFIISGGDDGMVIMWDVPAILTLHNIDYACQWVKDYLNNNVQVTKEQKTLCNQVNLRSN
jgi:WD40 repeat protein